MKFNHSSQFQSRELEVVPFDPLYSQAQVFAFDVRQSYGDGVDSAHDVVFGQAPEFTCFNLIARRPVYGMKRIMDVVVSFGLLLFLLPFLCVVWVMVRVTSAGPGLFWSRRVGIGGGIFMMPKFRTMPVGSPQMAREALGAGDGLTTSIGQFLRKLSIDELPQLWSVLVGDMSLVGPRPLLGNDPTTAIRQRLFPHCFGVRPGITGLAQVNGRNSVKPLAKARYDGFYAGHCSLGVDIKILLKTARAVLDVRRIL
jgi:O-antigen biosynthesis protein WbqP